MASCPGWQYSGVCVCKTAEILGLFVRSCSFSLLSKAFCTGQVFSKVIQPLAEHGLELLQWTVDAFVQVPLGSPKRIVRELDSGLCLYLKYILPASYKSI